MPDCLKILILSVCLFLLPTVQATIPAGYYESADGYSGAALKTQLYAIINNHTVLTYAELWTAFRKTDARADGKVWDVYSNITSYTFGDDQDTGSGGTSENDVYNREHSFPNSWFGGDKSSAMYTDLYHLYPSDKWVNAKRGNLPFGNVGTVTGYSANHYCEWGTSTESGSTLTVFEPADELKGDFARSYFYMVTCYENLVASWTVNDNTEMLGGNTYPAFSNWAQSVLLAWHRLDPVSAKETARNDSIYTLYQHNRNPFIDFPTLAEYVWGDSTSFAFHPANYLPSSINPVDTESDRLVAWSEDGELIVRTMPGVQIEIFDLTGRRLAAERASEGFNHFRFDGNQSLIIKAGSVYLKIVL